MFLKDIVVEEDITKLFTIAILQLGDWETEVLPMVTNCVTSVAPVTHQFAFFSRNSANKHLKWKLP